MAHEIFGTRFLANEVQGPAWHGIGTYTNDELLAEEAFDMIGAIDVTRERLFDQQGQYVDHDVIYREPTTDDPTRRRMAVVGAGYTMVTPRQAMRIADKAVGKPIETVGILKKGKVQFVTWELPEFQVGGEDRVKNYLVMFNPIDGNEAIKVWVSGMRVVCWNTLVASDKVASENYKIKHNEDAESDMFDWMNGIYGRSISKIEALKQAYDMMAAKTLSYTDASSVIEKVYAWPTPPTGFDTPLGEILTIEHAQGHVTNRIVQREAAPTSTYNSRVKAVGASRDAVSRIYFDNKGIGQHLDTAGASGWSLYNAVTEWETHRRSRGDNKAYSLFQGDRHDNMAQAYAAIMNLVDEGAEEPEFA